MNKVSAYRCFRQLCLCHLCGSLLLSNVAYAQSAGGFEPIAGPPGIAVDEPAPTIEPLVTEAAPIVATSDIVEEELGRIQAIQGGRSDRTPPLEPLGIRAGKFILRPSAETAIGYTTNSTGEASGEGSGFASLRAELRGQSDFERHGLDFGLRGTYDAFFSGNDSRDVTLGADVGFRYDVSAGITARLRGSYDESEDDLTGISDDPTTRIYSGTAELEVQRGLIGARFTGLLVRETNGSFRDAMGVSIDQSGDDSTLFGLRGRFSYESGAIIRPFVEAAVSREVFDDDSGGRNILGLELRGGLVFDRGEKLSGEVSLGYRTERPDGRNLDALSGVVAQASLLWSPQRFTQVRFDAATAFDAAPTSASAGEIDYTAGVSVERSLRDDIIVSAGADVSLSEEEGSGDLELGLGADLGVRYLYNRNLSLSAGYSYEYEDAARAVNDYDAHSIRFGLRVER